MGCWIHGLAVRDESHAPFYRFAACRVILDEACVTTLMIGLPTSAPTHGEHTGGVRMAWHSALRGSVGRQVVTCWPPCGSCARDALSLLHYSLHDNDAVRLEFFLSRCPSTLSRMNESHAAKDAALRFPRSRLVAPPHVYCSRRWTIDGMEDEQMLYVSTRVFHVDGTVLGKLSDGRYAKCQRQCCTATRST